MATPTDPNLDAKKYLAFAVASGLIGTALFVSLLFALHAPVALSFAGALTLAIFAGAAAALVPRVRRCVLAALRIALAALGFQMSIL